ncbi:sigma 54-interacting transcriptional regulator [Fodinisporobacter ferrooxydans]|uniref:Sigma 54-interacting transcriptional regulator n=1 Tax=Fodinisporobacter ferrooxydans TaxID=2901836 RepID=A0ABY4CQH1_9BACL|nr:sigma 54-interacting transcriptional regulator [Alicyclobacillaceae bacterium MYW30-H2]
MALGNFEDLSAYDNILVTDGHGVIVFYDMADLNVLKELGTRPEEFIGQHVTSFYRDLTNENSTVMNVLKNGVAICNVRQELITKKGNTFVSKNSTYPIKKEDTIIGAIEFSKHYFRKDNIRSLDKFAGHKIYRKNNTIYTIDNIITVNSRMKAIKNKIEKIARTNSTVLIYGRTGTGKEVVAQAIHNLSDRYEKPFISLNCGAVPVSLLESILFGTAKGSFTGSEEMPGLFEQAEGGTLFLDEVNSLDINLQVKLLKAIEEKTVRRIGGKKNINVDIRVISATNEDPDILLAEKRLREDLFFRLGVVEIDLPNLTERKEDIEVLVEYFINFYNNNMNIFIDSVQQEVLECFKGYDWPGNIRELRNAIETAYNNACSNQISLYDIPRRIRISGKNSMSDSAEINGSADIKVKSLRDTVEEFEREIIISELKTTNWKIGETARRLGVSKQLLKYKMDKYKLR